MAGKSLNRLRRLYRHALNDAITLDHLVPKSRNGPLNDEFNLFPFEKNRHKVWHDIFWNMTVFEVWDWLDYIHALIFDSHQEKICPVWFHVCCLETGTSKKIARFEEDKKNIIVKLIRIDFLHKQWLRCFKSPDIEKARFFLRYKMLFMIFGSKMVSRNYLLSDQNLKQMIREAVNHPARARAVMNCFGTGTVSCQEAKAIFNEILDGVSCL